MAISICRVNCRSNVINPYSVEEMEEMKEMKINWKMKRMQRRGQIPEKLLPITRV